MNNKTAKKLRKYAKHIATTQGKHKNKTELENATKYLYKELHKLFIQGKLTGKLLKIPKWIK